MKAVWRILASLAVVSVGVAALALVVANVQWAEVIVPALPGSDGSPLVTFEVQVWALLLVPFLLGACFGILMLRIRQRGRASRAAVSEEAAWETNDPDPRV